MCVSWNLLNGLSCVGLFWFGIWAVPHFRMMMFFSTDCSCVLSSFLPTSLIFDLFSVMVASSLWLFLSSVCYMPHPFHFPSSDHPNNICHRVQIRKVLIMQYERPAVTSSPYVQICPTAPCSESHTACVLPLIWQIKFHTHTKPKEKLYIFIACFLGY
jgi:hypothetical protein